MDWISLNQIRVKFVAYKYIRIYIVECIVEEKEREGGDISIRWRINDGKREKLGKKGGETRVKTQTSTSI